MAGHDRHWTADEGCRLLRRQHEGTLVYGERRAEVRFVHDPGSGRLLLPLEPAALRADEVVILAPREDEQELQVSGTPERIDRPESHAGVDRWTAYHGRASSSTWALVRIDAAKSETGVWDGEDLMRANPLGAHEARVLRPLNADAARLARLCRARTGAAVAEPVAVGVDPFGLDVRARFGVLRVEFEHPAEDADAAERAVWRLLEVL